MKKLTVISWSYQQNIDVIFAQSFKEWKGEVLKTLADLVLGEELVVEVNLKERFFRFPNAD